MGEAVVELLATVAAFGLGTMVGMGAYELYKDLRRKWPWLP